MKTLPTSEYPIYTILIPSLKRECRFRPLIVKEEKALMIAQAEENNKLMLETLRSVIGSCLMETDVDVDELSLFDCEYLLVKLRAISIGEEVTVMLKCSDPHEGHEQSRLFGVACNLNNVKVIGLENYNPNVKINDNLMVHMVAPTIDSMLFATEETEDISEYEKNFRLVASLIKEIITKDEVIDCSEFSVDEMCEWLEGLPADGYEKILNFFNNLPRVVLQVEWDCPYCGKHNVRLLSGLSVFF